MKIALVGPVPPPNGGMAMQTMQLLSLLEARGHEVNLIETNPAYRPSWIARVPVVRALFRLLPYFWRLWSGMKGADVVHLMANSGWAFHLFARPACFVARIRGIPVVINYRGGKARTFFASSWSRIEKAMNSAAAIVVPSGFLKDVFKDFGKEAIVVPNIIDLSVFNYRPQKAPLDAPHIIVTRNLEPIYDNATAINSFRIVADRFPQARFTIAGSGPCLDALKTQSQRLGLSDVLSFVGRLDRPQMSSLYESADIMVNASQVDNMPNSLLEALASGVNVVTTNVGGIPYMVEHEKTALMVEPERPEAMALAIIRLLEDRELAKHLAATGRDSVKCYSPEHVVPLWESVYGRDNSKSTFVGSSV